MSKDNSGLFTGTIGDNVVSNTDKSTGSKTYSETEILRNHIENVESVSGRCVIGGHNKESFMNAVRENSILIESTLSSNKIEGVEKITYKIPARDKTGKPTGEYKSASLVKTVYDPVKISTDEYISRGLEAANNAAKSNFGKLGREWSGLDNIGVRWRGYCNSSGEITSIYPED